MPCWRTVSRRRGEKGIERPSSMTNSSSAGSIVTSGRLRSHSSIGSTGLGGGAWTGVVGCSAYWGGRSSTEGWDDRESGRGTWELGGGLVETADLLYP